MASGLVVIVIAWCVRMRGPMFVSVFNPLMLVLVAVADSLMFGENLYVGRYATSPCSFKFDVYLNVNDMFN